MAAPAAPARLHMNGVHKRFGATTALAGVSLEVAPGEVHAVLGENGAGKSTLMKILAGAVTPDEGDMHIDGRGFSPRNPLDARRAGVAMMHQELSLAPHLSVEANLTLGMERHAFGLLSPRHARMRVQDVLARLRRSDIRPHIPVNRLPPATRQIIEIARALMSEARVIVMDEPTSSLDIADVENLFHIIASLKRDGVSVIYISHFLEEVSRVADRWTVLRDGAVAATGDMQDTSTERLVELMIGRRLEEQYPVVVHALKSEQPALEVRELHGIGRLPRGASLHVRPGEILGVAGLVGAGRTELLRCVFGLDGVQRGEIVVAGHSRRRTSPAIRLSQGVGLLSEDRAGEGLAMGMSIAENLTLGGLRRVSRFGWISRRKEREGTDRHAAALATTMRDADQRIGELSGGNQQKIAVARLLYRDVDVLLLDEPTRGIDVGSKAHIYRAMGELATAGKAIIFVSSAVPELLGVCDRIVVMHRGRVVADRPRDRWSEPELVHAAVTGIEASNGAFHAA